VLIVLVLVVVELPPLKFISKTNQFFFKMNKKGFQKNDPMWVRFFTIKKKN